MSQTPFNQDFLKKLDQLALYATMVAKGIAGGNRKSRQKGSSIEFSDYREYSLGDDFRRIDWNAYGRFEKLFVKLFMEEAEIPVTIFLDCSKSMDWGDPHKGNLAKQLAAVFSYIALANFDRIAITALNEGIKSSLPAFSGKQGFWKALKYIEMLPYEGKTAINAAIQGYRPLGPGGGISILITDLFSRDGYREALKYLQYCRQELTLIHILAPQELDPPWQGSIRLIDSEGEEARDITVTPQLVKAYKRVLEGFIKENREFCYNRGINYILLSSGLSLEQVVFENLMKLGLIK